MAITDYNKQKKIEVTDKGGSNPTISNTHNYYVKIVSGSNSTTGTGDITIDTTNVDGKEDIALYDSNDNLLDYYWQRFDTANDIYEARFNKTGLVRDNTVQVKVAFGSGSTDESTTETTVWNGVTNIQNRYSFNQTPPVDSTSNNNDMSATGTSTVSDSNVFGGTAVSSDGSDDQLNQGSNFEGGNADSFTWLMLAKSSDTSDDFAGLFGVDDSTGSGSLPQIIVRTSNSKFAFGNDDGPGINFPNNSVDGNWHTLGVKNDVPGDSATRVFDGSLATATGTNTTSFSKNLQAFVERTDGVFLAAELNEVVLYNAAIDEDYMVAFNDMSPLSQTLFSQQAAESTSSATTKTVSVDYDAAIKDTGLTVTVDYDANLGYQVNGNVTVEGSGTSGVNTIIYNLTTDTFLTKTTTDSNGDYSYTDDGTNISSGDEIAVAVQYFDSGTNTYYGDLKSTVV